ncbi:hypothetical protein [Anaerocolumna jejuensis]|uniref:hypothetical protein n=1 Tax=Anaerocolumna jejuensis TaxID=259063 RepID=UPI003F7BF5BD
MSDFILEYDVLESIAVYSKFLGKRAEEYEENLENKIISGIANVTGSSTGYLKSASDSVKDKINTLKQKSDAFYHYAEQITNLLETAERIDQEVADAITAQREYFLDHHKSLRLDDWKAKLLGLLVDLKNSIPLLGTIADLLEGLNTVIESLEDSIRHWYECEGGKYVIKEIEAVAGACLAIAIFAATFPVSTFAGFCLAVGTGIAALNSCVNVKTSYQAANAAMDGNPAWAEIYGNRDTLSDVLRQKNYGNGIMNDLSNFTAGALDVTEAVCITVGMAGQIVNLFKESYNMLRYSRSMNYSGLQSNFESGSVELENVIKMEYRNADSIGLLDDAGAAGKLKEGLSYSEGGSETINGLKIIDGKVDGKIPIDEYNRYRIESIHNPSSDTMTLGKYRPSIKADGTEDWKIAGPDSYTVKAGDNKYFSLGDDWGKITDIYGLDSKGKDMFKYFNIPALDDAVLAGNEIRFSHDPRIYGDCALKDEWFYLQNKYGFKDLYKEGEFWYAIK